MLTIAATIFPCTISPATAAPVLRSAQVVVKVTGPSACEVSMTLVVDGGVEIDHRLETLQGTEVDELRVDDAPASAPRMVGTTRSIVIGPVHGSYRVSYRVRQTGERTPRCPLWLPAVPADGVSRAITLTMELPQGSIPGTTMPRFVWKGATGVATLGHLPAFVLAPHSSAGEQPPWDVATAMDVSAVAVFLGASAIWAWRRRRASRTVGHAER